jgi:protein involved in polysaccharide export with SLBB domain
LFTLSLLALLVTQTTHAQKGDIDPPTQPIGATVIGDAVTFPIRAFDSVYISVTNGPEFTKQYTVQQDGTITIGKLGKIPLSGMNQAQAQNKIKQRLIERKQLTNPVVVVTLLTRKAREVIISGEVKKRGRVPLREGGRLGDAIDAADPTENADLTRVSLVDKKDVERGPINYQEFLSGTGTAAKSNPILHDGDTVLIRPQIVQEGRFKITGEIKEPKPFYAVLKSLTVTQAIQSANGLTELADKEKIIVRRGAESIPVPYRDVVEKSMLGKDVILKNGDEIFIPRRERALSYSVSGAIQASSTLFPLRDNTSVRTAVLEARPAENAKLDKVRLIRTGESDMFINIKKGQGDDIILQDGDKIEVPFERRSNRPDFLNTATQLLSTYWLLRQIQITSKR